MLDNNYIKINYQGKEYIGQIESINSDWTEFSTVDNIKIKHLNYYEVCIIEKDTNLLVEGIIIKSFSEIKPYIL